MTAEEVYIKYINKVEKNSTTDYFSTSRDKFAEMYNELSKRVLRLYTRNRNLDIRKDIQKLLVDDLLIVNGEKHLDHYDFKIPNNYFDWSSIRATASKGKCRNEDIYLYEIRDEDRGEFLNNNLYKPSFSYREAPYLFSSDKIKIFTEEGMKIEKVYLSYYKQPQKITLQDPYDPESQFNDIQIEIKEEVVDRIVSAMVGEFKINQDDPNFQLDKLRQNENLIQ